MCFVWLVMGCLLTCSYSGSKTPYHTASLALHFPSLPLSWFWIYLQTHNTKCSQLFGHLYLQCIKTNKKNSKSFTLSTAFSGTNSTLICMGFCSPDMESAQQNIKHSILTNSMIQTRNKLDLEQSSTTTEWRKLKILPREDFDSLTIKIKC